MADVATDHVLHSNSQLGLPLRLTLTEAGASYFAARGKRLQRVRLADDREGYGFNLHGVTLPLLRRLFHAGFVSMCETGSADLLQYRSDITGLTELIVYDFLQHRTRAELGAYTKSGTDGDADALRSWLLDTVRNSTVKSGDQEALKEREVLLEGLLGSMEEQDRKSLSARIESSPEDYEAVVAVVHRYIRQSSIAPYLSLLVAELIGHAQHTNLCDYASTRVGQRVPLKQLVMNPEARGKLLSEMERHGDLVSLGWQMTPPEQQGGNRQKLLISVFTGHYEFYRVRDEVNVKMNANMKSTSLGDLFSQEQDEFFDPSLGLYYLSCLSDICHTLDVHFDSTVSRVSRTGVSLITLVLQF